MISTYKTILLLITTVLLSHSVQSIPLPPFPSVANLPYQAHSFNDIPYIRQLMKRGVKYFKIDVSMANRESCLKNSDWKPSQPCFNTTQYSEETCCLALRGDTSGRNSFDYKFNTLDDFVDLLEHYLAENPIQKILFFAINHQFDFQFKNLISQNLTFKLAKLMETYPLLHLGFGNDNFILEYDRVCRNSIESQNQKQQQLLLINMLNQQACTEQRKFISKANFFLQSGDDTPSDPRDYRGRYRNFNVYYKGITERCEKGFPAWIKKEPNFPLIFWQPSNERQIQFVLQAFMSQKCRLLHGRGLDGLAITSNIDPQVFQFYLKMTNQSKSEKSIQFYPSNQKMPLLYTNNLLTKIVINNFPYLILGQQDSSSSGLNGDNQPGFLSLSMLDKNMASGKVFQIMKKEISIKKKTQKIIGGLDNMIIMQVSGNGKGTGTGNDQGNDKKINSQTYQLTLVDNTFTPLTSVQIDSVIDICSFNGVYYILRRTSGDANVFNILKTSNLDKNSIISSFRLPQQKSQSIQSLLVFEDILSDKKLKVLVSGSLDRKTHTNTHDTLALGNAWISDVDVASSTVKAIAIGFGDNPQLALKQSGQVLLSLQNGACNSAVLINNGDTPLCQYYKYPQLRPTTSTKSTITIIQTTYQNLLIYINQMTNQPITPCTPKFLHYKALNGRNINIADIWSQLYITTQYVHISQQGIINSLFCAPSNFQILTNNRKGLLGTITSRKLQGKQQIQQLQQLQQLRSIHKQLIAEIQQ